MLFTMKPGRFLSITILSTSMMIGLISQLQASAASPSDGFTNQFPNVDKLTRQEIAELRRSFAQKTIKEMKQQKEATGEMDPGLFVMDIKADTKPAQKTSDEDKGPLTEADISEDERCTEADMDLDEVVNSDDDKLSASVEQTDSKQPPATVVKPMRKTQLKSSASDTSTNQNEVRVQEQPTTSNNKDDKTPTSKKMATPDKSPKDETSTKKKSQQKKPAKDSPTDDRQAETQSHAADKSHEDQNSNDGEQIRQMSSSAEVNDEDRQSPATDKTGKEPTSHESTLSNNKAGGKTKKTTATDTDKKGKASKPKKLNQKKSSATENAKPDSEKSFKEEL